MNNIFEKEYKIEIWMASDCGNYHEVMSSKIIRGSRDYVINYIAGYQQALNDRKPFEGTAHWEVSLANDSNYPFDGDYEGWTKYPNNKGVKS